MPSNKTIENKIIEATSRSPIADLAEKINKLIECNLDEALESDCEYIRKKAEQIKQSK